MQTTVGALARAEPALMRLAEQAVSFKSAHHVRKLVKLVNEETQFFHEQRDAILIKYGTPRGGQAYEVAPEKIGEVNAQIDELANVPVVLDQWLLTPAILESYTVSAADLAALDDLIVLETPTP